MSGLLYIAIRGIQQLTSVDRCTYGRNNCEAITSISVVVLSRILSHAVAGVLKVYV